MGTVDGFNVSTAKSCRAAVDLVASGVNPPDWIVIDLILSQGGWGGSLVRYPGLKLLRYFKESYGSRFGLLAFSVVITEPIADMAKEAGAMEVLAKPANSWHGVLATIRDLQKRRPAAATACGS
jgi:ActR/RegA family two-component response regulator